VNAKYCFELSSHLLGFIMNREVGADIPGGKGALGT